MKDTSLFLWGHSKYHSIWASLEIKGHKSLNIKDFIPPYMFEAYSYLTECEEPLTRTREEVTLLVSLRHTVRSSYVSICTTDKYTCAGYSTMKTVNRR